MWWGRGLECDFRHAESKPLRNITEETAKTWSEGEFWNSNMSDHSRETCTQKLRVCKGMAFSGTRLVTRPSSQRCEQRPGIHTPAPSTQSVPPGCHLIGHRGAVDGNYGVTCSLPAAPAPGWGAPPLPPESFCRPPTRSLSPAGSLLQLRGEQGIPPSL